MRAAAAEKAAAAAAEEEEDVEVEVEDLSQVMEALVSPSKSPAPRKGGDGGSS